MKTSTKLSKGFLEIDDLGAILSDIDGVMNDRSLVYLEDPIAWLTDRSPTLSRFFGYLTTLVKPNQFLFDLANFLPKEIRLCFMTSRNESLRDQTVPYLTAYLKEKRHDFELYCRQIGEATISHKISVAEMVLAEISPKKLLLIDDNPEVLIQIKSIFPRSAIALHPREIPNYF
ncbi:MAG: hypothetical protein NTW50_05635 [Candidatus Berkelbacteria bacterium]|nr:hypothetical protein [Candidatus Berkelbacteria bacterium]